MWDPSPVTPRAASTAPGLLLHRPGPVPFIFDDLRRSPAFPPPVEAIVGDGFGLFGALGRGIELDLLKARGRCFEPDDAWDRGAGFGFILMRCDMLVPDEAWVAMGETSNERIGRQCELKVAVD